MRDLWWWNWPAGGRKIGEYGEYSASRKALNFRVQYEGVSPQHVYKEPLIRFLPDIINTANTSYKLNYDFDVNIEPKEQGSDAVMVTIRHPIDMKNIPGIGQKSESEINALAEQLALEQVNNNQEAARFKKLYKKEMQYKGWRIWDYSAEAVKLITG